MTALLNDSSEGSTLYDSGEDLTISGIANLITVDEIEELEKQYVVVDDINELDESCDQELLMSLEELSKLMYS